jgi:hypothetical protein
MTDHIPLFAHFTIPGRMLCKMSGMPGLPGVHQGVAVHGPDDAIEWLNAGRIVTSAGPGGSISCWRDAAGRLRCNFSLRKQPLSNVECADLAEVAAWLQAWWPKMRRPEGGGT